MDVKTFTRSLVHLEQGSPLWLDWRKGVPGKADEWAITGTDSAIILNKSKFATPRYFVAKKLGMLPPQYVSHAMKRGNILEPAARACYEEMYEDYMQPTCVQVAEYPWLKASLDGLSIDGEDQLEIKCPNAATHAMALAGRVPEMYWIQIQHQLMCSRAKRCWYFSFDGESGAPRIEVLPDPAFQQTLFDAECVFRQHLFNRTHPEGDDWAAAAARYILMDADAVEADELREAAKEGLIALLGTENSRQGGGVKISRATIPGKVDYPAYLCKQLNLEKITTEDLLAAFAEKHGVDLRGAEVPEYTKKDVTRILVTIAKDIDIEAIKEAVEPIIEVSLVNAAATADHRVIGEYSF